LWLSDNVLAIKAKTVPTTTKWLSEKAVENGTNASHQLEETLERFVLSTDQALFM